MTWEAALVLIARFGLPFVMEVIDQIKQGKSPTDADWNKLSTLAKENARSRAVAMLTEAGVALDSPEAKMLLTLVEQQP